MPSPLARPARDLVQAGRVGFFSTLLRQSPGHPYVSLVPYAPDAQGRPVFLLSGIAAHTRNLLHDARASLLVTGPDVFNDPRNTARATVMGRVEPVAEDEIEAVQAGFLALRPDDAPLLELADFGFFRMTVTEVHFVGGFGQAGWIGAADYTECPASNK